MLILEERGRELSVRPRVYPRHVQSRPAPAPRLCWNCKVLCDERTQTGVTDTSGRTVPGETPTPGATAGDPTIQNRVWPLCRPRVATSGNEVRARVGRGGAV